MITFAVVNLCWKQISTVYDELSGLSRTARTGMSVWRFRLSGVRCLSIVPLDVRKGVA